MGIITWLIFGALVGWVASIIMKRNSEMGSIANIVVGVIGAALGGWIASLLGIGTVTGFNFYSLLIALVGACVLLLVIGLVQKATKTEKH
ncbi:MAG: GlsB/YeaQ/YmgE family stress response membrane protein [Clostridia bacterium]|nr:GlsB/YeaQ/YmgE family stress response membrane protein [Clostridia bacterium]